MVRLTIAALAALITINIPSYSAAQQLPCLPRAEWQRILGDTFRETPVGVGVVGTRAILEMYASPDGATWTIIEVFPGGMACGVASGQDWQPLIQGDPS